ncbi:hypothetical protein SDC9_198861 [bioreactor metagenome]|uniref:Uncharacterized protein n=1 Tax=bioreactor metagenome TaxID=1076179 RepID=A0A645IL74_9ZZZZ
MAELVAIGKLLAPDYTGPYLSDDKYWLVGDSTVQRAGKYWTAATSHRYADMGWNTELYSEAT